MSTRPPTRAEYIDKLIRQRDRINQEIARVENELREEIRAMKRARNAATLAATHIPKPHRHEAVCGTDGGYYRHRRTLNEEACAACKLAHRVYEAERQQRRKEAAA